MATASSIADVGDVAWLSKVLGRPVASTKSPAGDLEKINKSSAMQFFRVTFAGDSEDGGGGVSIPLVLKKSEPGDRNAKLFGLAREGLFYNQWSELETAAKESTAEATEVSLGSVLPKVWHAEGDMATGHKIVVVEDLSSCVQAGYFFGSSNVNNWGKDLEQEKKSLGALTPREVTTLSFSAAAKLHAVHWNNYELRGKETTAWLRGSEWLAGKGKESWEASQANVARLWAKIKGKQADGSCQVEFDPNLIACLDAAIEKTSWEAYQTEAGARSFTLTHGDFHPGNIMVHPDGRNVSLIDWEVVGVGSGPQDLGQFMISHPEPKVRAEIERDAVTAYYTELTSLNPSIALTFEECWAEYVAGGLGRWLWFVPLLVDMCPPKMGQFFVDQVQAFTASHKINPDNVPMPRA